MLPYVLQCRYYMFNCGIGPTPWVDGGGSWVRDRKYDFHDQFVGEKEFPDEACDARDTEALVQLLETLSKKS